MPKKGKKAGDGGDSPAGGGGGRHADKEEEIDPQVIKFENQNLRLKIDRLEIRVAGLSQQFERASQELENHHRESDTILKSLKEAIQDKDNQISALLDRVGKAEESKRQTELEFRQNLETEQINFAENMRNKQQEIVGLREELQELHDFKLKKAELEAEIEQLHKQVVNQRHAHEVALSELDRKILQEKDRLRKDMLFKLKDAKANLLKMTDEHLTNTTKRTMAENEQMRAELAYQSKWTKEIIQINQKLNEEVTILRKKVTLYEDAHQKYAERSASGQRVIKLLIGKLKTIESHKNAEKSYLEQKKDHEISVLFEELESREEKINRLTDEVNMLKARLEAATHVSPGSADQEQVLNILSGAASLVLNTLGSVKDKMNTSMPTEDADSNMEKDFYADPADADTEDYAPYHNDESDSQALPPIRVHDSKLTVSPAKWDKNASKSQKSKDTKLNQSKVSAERSPVSKASGSFDLTTIVMNQFGGWAADTSVYQNTGYQRYGFDAHEEDNENLDESGFGPVELERTAYFETAAVVATPYQSHDGFGLIAYGFDGLLFDDIEEFFSNFGRIKAKGVPKRGNWLYLWYETEEDFIRALGADGHFFENRTMIGVFPVPQDKPIEPGTLVYRMPVESELLDYQDTQEGTDVEAAADAPPHRA